MNKVKARLIRFLILGSLLLFGIGGYMALNAPDTTSSTSSSSIGVAGVELGGPFTLLDHNGKTVTDDDFKNTYKLIYFGFTYCPAVCPTELQKMTAALQSMGSDADQILPIFITVDPERDTVELVNQYMEFFHPRMVGLTGSREQIDHVLKLYKVYAARIDDEDATDYTMDHSSFIYFMSPDDDVLRIFRTQDTAQDIATQLDAYFNAQKSG